MKQWNLRMKKLWSKTLLVKPWLKRTEMKRPVHICENFSKKAIRIVVRLVTLKMLKYSMAYTIKFHCLWGNVLSAANKKLSPNFFGKVWTMHVYIYIYICVCVCVCMCVLLVYESVYIEKMLIERQFFMTLIKLRIDFLITDLCSQHFGIELVVFVLRFFIFINMR